MNKKDHIEKLADGREVHFDKKDHMNPIRRYCPYCGSDNLYLVGEWPKYLCLNCGLPFHDDDAQQSYDDFLEYRKKVKQHEE